MVSLSQEEDMLVDRKCNDTLARANQIMNSDEDFELLEELVEIEIS